MRGPVAGDGGRAFCMMAARWQQDQAARGGWQRAGLAWNGTGAPSELGGESVTARLTWAQRDGLAAAWPGAGLFCCRQADGCRVPMSRKGPQGSVSAALELPIAARAAVASMTAGVVLAAGLLPQPLAALAGPGCASPPPVHSIFSTTTPLRRGRSSPSLAPSGAALWAMTAETAQSAG